MHKSKGFTLVELIISMLLSVTLFLAFFSLFDRFQIWASNLNLMLERDENLWLSPLLLSRWIAPAGNNRWTDSWTGLTIEPEEIGANSDMEGPDGFPDSQLSSRFEKITLRQKDSGLQLKSGNGSFQPVLKNISSLRVDSQNLPLINLQISAATERPLWALNESLSQSAVVTIYLWNYRPNLFAEAP